MDATQHARFGLKTVEELQALCDRLGVSLPFSQNTAVLGEPVLVAGRNIPNRLAVHPMEGFDSTPDGAPGELAFRRYLRYARGGFGLIWVEATSVLAEGRSNPGQFWIHRRNLDSYRRLVTEIRKAATERYGRDVVLVIQLTHSGRYSKPDGKPAPIIAHHSKVLDPPMNLPEDYPLVTDEYLDKLRDSYAAAGELAAAAGFDGVDVKSCHRYLISELLASVTREGRYGGSFENRTRFLRETIARIRTSAPSVFVTTRLNVYDAIPHPYGFGVAADDFRSPDLREPIELIRDLKAGGVPLLNITAGNPYSNPHVNRPYDTPARGGYVPEEHPLAGVARLISITGQVQMAFPDLPVVGTGYSWLRHMMPCVAAGAVRQGLSTLVGLGRGAFAYPDQANSILSTGHMDPAKCCITCSACTQLMRDGVNTGCVVRDSGTYRLTRQQG